MENYRLTLEDILSLDYYEDLVYFIVDKIDKAPRGTDIYPEYVFGSNSMSIQQSTAWFRALATLARDYNGFTLPSQGEIDSALADVEFERSSSAYVLGRYFEFGLGVETDESKAADYYTKAVLKDGNDDALIALGLLYLQGRGVEKNEEFAYNLFLRAAKQGNPIARLYVGRCYMDGIYVPADIDEAIKWYELSANGHLVDAYWILDKIYKERGEYNKVIYWGDRFTEYGFPQAMLKMGVYYMEGQFIERDPIKGFSLIHEAAETGFPAALFNLSLCYYKGDGTARDDDQGFKYLKQAAESRYPIAEYELGRMLWDSNREYAESLLCDAAQQHYAPAMEFIGTYRMNHLFD